jgi:hypothetical protein
MMKFSPTSSGPGFTLRAVKPPPWSNSPSTIEPMIVRYSPFIAVMIWTSDGVGVRTWGWAACA